MFRNLVSFFILLLCKIFCANNYCNLVERCELKNVKDNFSNLQDVNFVIFKYKNAKWCKNKKELFQIIFYAPNDNFSYVIYCNRKTNNIKSVDFFTFNDFDGNVFKGTLDKKVFFDYDKGVWPDLCSINWRLENDISNNKLQWSENDGYPVITWNSKPNVNSSIEKIVKNGDYYEGELWINYHVIYLKCYWRISLNIFERGLSALGLLRFNRESSSESENSFGYADVDSIESSNEPLLKYNKKIKDKKNQ